MKNSIKILDCTLRDGGYLNDWCFGYTNILNIFERLVDARVDYVEVGFIDDRRPYDIERSIFPDTKSIAKTFMNVDKKNTLVLGMIDFGTCDISNIQKQRDQFLDGIRVIFKKSKAAEALKYCAQIKKLGYKVFAQLVSITSYNDKELKEVIDIVNKVEPYAVSIVDTYGLLDLDKTKHYFSIIDKYLKSSINIGFHGHNNFQLAFANSCELIELKKNHNLIVDGTLDGMGKSAGNAPIELISKFLNSRHQSNYDVSVMMEAISESINEFKDKVKWGYQPFYFMCAKNEVHPSYLTYFKSKNKLSSTKLNQLLKMIKGDKKLLYDEKYANGIYNSYIKKLTNDENEKKFKNVCLSHPILLIGPGQNIKLQRTKVINYIKNNKPVIIAINYIPNDIKIDYLFISNAYRYKEMIPDLNLYKKLKVISTTNVEPRIGEFYLTYNYKDLIDVGAKYEDNSFLMFLSVLENMNIKEIFAAGFDGYSKTKQNYINKIKSYNISFDELKNLNRHVRDVLMNKFKIKIKFITFSEYLINDLNNTEI